MKLIKLEHKSDFELQVLLSGKIKQFTISDVLIVNVNTFYNRFNEIHYAYITIQE